MRGIVMPRVAPTKIVSAGAVPRPGIVPSTGTSPNDGPAGTIAFETKILVAIAQPQIDERQFPVNFAWAVQQILPRASAEPSDVSIRVDAVTGPEADAILRASSPENTRWPYDFPVAHWVSIVGAFTAGSPWQLSGAQGLNRAIARAFAASTTLRSAYGLTDSVDEFIAEANRNGAALNTALNASRACAGRRNLGYGKTFAAACTRWAVLPRDASEPAPVTSLEPPVTRVRTQYDAVPQRHCFVSPVDRFWLRSSPTFEKIGPIFPPGTRVELLQYERMQRGIFHLFRVRVLDPRRGDLDGWAAFRYADLAATGDCVNVGANSALLHSYGGS